MLGILREKILSQSGFAGVVRFLTKRLQDLSFRSSRVDDKILLLLRENRKHTGQSQQDQAGEITFHENSSYPWKFITLEGRLARVLSCFAFAAPQVCVIL